MLRRSSCLLTLALWSLTGLGEIAGQTHEAKPRSAEQLRSEIDEILADEGRAPLERIRSLRDLIAAEEILLTKQASAKWIEQLGDSSYRKRAEAEAKLKELGPAAMDLLESGAADDDFERASRCLGLLVKLAEGKNEAAAKLALHAIERIANSEASRVRGQAAKRFGLLSLTDQQRAAQALESAGARLYRTKEGDVRSISVIQGQFSNAQMRLLRHFPKASRLSVRGEKITDAGLSHLAEMPALSSVTLLESSITDEGLEIIANLDNVDRLSLGKAKFTNRGLQKLQTMNLRSLALMRVSLTQETAEVLQGLKNVSSLSLSLRAVSDDEMRWLGSLSNLGYLSIDESPTISNQGLAPLKSLQLRSLSIGDCQIGDEGLAHLSGMQGLSSLNIGDNRITDAGLVHLKELSSLTMLMLNSHKITDAGLAHLTELDRLRYLTLRKAKITGECIESLKNFRQLSHLNLSDTKITDQDIKDIREALPKLSIQH